MAFPQQLDIIGGFSGIVKEMLGKGMDRHMGYHGSSKGGRHAGKKSAKKHIYGRRSRGSRRTRIAIVAILTVLTVAVLVLAAGLIVWVMMKQPSQAPVSTPSSTAPTSEVPRVTLPASFLDANTQSKSVVLYDITNDRALYTKAGDERREPASLTKLLTASLACQYATEGYIFRVGSELSYVHAGDSRAWLQAGEQLNLDMILKALLIPSGNDAAYTIAVNLARTVSGDANLSDAAAVAKFVEMMNSELAALGATNTHFSNPDGSHADDHYTTANDMLKIVKHAMTYPAIVSACALPSTTETLLTGQQCTWTNTNALLLESKPAYYNPDVTGMKTGSTPEAGYCLVASAQKDGRTLVTVLLGSESDRGRYEDANGLLQIGFQNG